MERPPSRRTTLRRARLVSLLKPQNILNNVDDIPGDQLVSTLLQHMALEYGIGNIRTAIAEVEANMTKDDVHAGSGLAVLYGRLDKVEEPLLALAVSKAGIMFAGKRIHVLACVLTPPDMPGAYKQILHGLYKACETWEDSAHIGSLPSPLAVWQHFEASGHNLPDHLQARHIMTKPEVFLNSDDNLAKAIDLFLAHRASELPVLSPAREIIGVVTTRRLVNVCMPEYLMWVEDMTPFLNFEPIAEIIRDAPSTWLKDIMVQDIALVQESSPAILALKEIGRRETNNAYVIRGRELVGIVYLHEFLNSVLR